MRRPLGNSLSTASLVLLCGCALGPSEGEPGRQRSGLSEIPDFGTNPGGLQMYLYVPSGLPSGPAPLVVAMHGCSQTAADFVGAGWNELADRLKLYVIYPQKSAGWRCFGWSEPANRARDAGEALSIKQMVDYAESTHAIDPARVFATGLSAGGAMTAVMLAAYPDVFAAGASMSGVPYGCDALCMSGQVRNTAQEWGDAVRGAFASFHGSYPRMSIWQGKADAVVAPGNLGELTLQWTNVLGIDAIADATETVGPATHREYRDPAGLTLVESWEIAGMGHGAALDPARRCGTEGAFMLDVQLCSVEWAARFFGLLADSADAGGADGSAPPVDAGAAPGDEDPKGCGCGAAAAEGVALVTALLAAALGKRRRSPLCSRPPTARGTDHLERNALVGPPNVAW